jgi:hypothetical protein
MLSKLSITISSRTKTHSSFTNSPHVSLQDVENQKSLNKTIHRTESFGSRKTSREIILSLQGRTVTCERVRQSDNLAPLHIDILKRSQVGAGRRAKIPDKLILGGILSYAGPECTISVFLIIHY